MTDVSRGVGRPVILIAGGGTGGHVFPGVAVAEALRDIADVRVVFAGTKRGLEARVIPEKGYELVTLEVSAMQGGGLARFLRGGFSAGKAAISGFSEIRRLRPRAILSVGGYAAGPISLAGALLGVPLAVYEPNRVSGFTNRVLSPFAKRMYLAWEESATRHPRKARVFGVPLRSGFSKRDTSHVHPRELTVLVLGGSQGAKRLNERVPQALRAVLATLPSSVHVRIVHQAGAGKAEAVQQAYGVLGLDADVRAFIDDMPAMLRAADLVIGRAGATAVAEVCASASASILVPFPFAADDHQAENARALAQRGGCMCVLESEFDGEKLENAIRTLLTEPEVRANLAEKAHAWNQSGAAARIAHDLLGLAGCAKRPSNSKVTIESLSEGA